MLSETVADHVSPVNNDLKFGPGPMWPGFYNNEGEERTRPFCDKIRLMFDLNLADKDRGKAVYDGAYDFSLPNSPNHIKGVSVKKPGKNGKTRVLSLLAPQPGDIAKPYRDKSPAMLTLSERDAWLEFNPAKWDAQQSKRLVEVLCAILLVVPPEGYEEISGGQDICWAEFIASATVTKIDIAVDFVGLNLRKLVVSDATFKKRETHENNGAIETVYLHNGKNGNAIIIYDKTAEQKKFCKISERLQVPHEVVRIEARLVAQKGSLDAFTNKRKNPFQTFRCSEADSTVASMFKIYPTIGEIFASALVQSPTYVHRSLSDITYANALTTALGKHPLPQWDAKKIWSEWNPECLGPALSMFAMNTPKKSEKTFLSSFAKQILSSEGEVCVPA